MNHNGHPLILWGGTGHARVLRELAARQDRSVLAIADNRAIDPPWPGVPTLLGLEGLRQWLAATAHNLVPEFALAIGGSHGRDRLQISAALQQLGMCAATLIHPLAAIANDALIAPGAQILLGAAIASCARIGTASIVNTRASVDHDCRIGDGAHIGPGAALCGEVDIGTCAFVGAGATVLPRLHIGADAVIGAGAVVTRDVPAGAVYTGNPARPHPGSLTRG